MFISKRDLGVEIERINNFIRQTVYAAGFERVIIGLSGGIDSAVTSALCVRALGVGNVFGVMLPYRTSHPDSLNHAVLLGDSLKIKYETVDISGMVDGYFGNEKPDIMTAELSLRRGNLMARCRMCVLYDLSAKYRALVVGTSNKSELWMGYCTQYGDSACAFEPLAHIYKTEVRELARLLNVPAEIINKAPSADLWEGQTDEGELGISYLLLDEILTLYIDEKRERDYILQQGIAAKDFDIVINKIKSSEFKRRLPLAIENIWGE